MSNFRKRSLLILVLVLCVGLLSACNSKSQPLSSDFDKAKVEEAGKAVIALVNAQDNQGLRDMGVDEIKQGLTDEALQPVHDRIKLVGDFKGIENMEVSGHKDEAGNEYAVLVARAEYGDKQAVVYTISFTKDMELAGLYAK